MQTTVNPEAAFRQALDNVSKELGLIDLPLTSLEKTAAYNAFAETFRRANPDQPEFEQRAIGTAEHYVVAALRR